MPGLPEVDGEFEYVATWIWAVKFEMFYLFLLKYIKQEHRLWFYTVKLPCKIRKESVSKLEQKTKFVLLFCVCDTKNCIGSLNWYIQFLNIHNKSNFLTVLCNKCIIPVYFLAKLIMQLVCLCKNVFSVYVQYKLNLFYYS